MRARDLNRVDVEVRRVEELEGKVGLDSSSPTDRPAALTLPLAKMGEPSLMVLSLQTFSKLSKDLKLNDNSDIFFFFSAFVLFCIFFFFLSR